MDLTILMIIAGGALGIWGSIQDEEARKKKIECKQAQVETTKSTEAPTNEPLAVSSTKTKP